MTKLASILVVFLVLALNATAQSDWKGSYSFDEDGGRSTGGSAILISHELEIFDGDKEIAATLQSNGYQTSTNLVCTAKVQGAKLLIYFQSYGEDNMFEPYEPGDLLFTLERKGKTVLTHWGKFTPAIPKYQKSGKVYFAKTPSK